MWQERLAQLVTTCHWIGAKGWAPATGGNMSVRQDETLVLAQRVGTR
ncbi:Methylthioribulose-1-phosphate dehydratase [Raoultella terrigena]|uniref:Methylthioribulose-1-phosphate dehydratase n=1 Tax=Raoultella terrigena TaxID=577 RepID=A0A7Z9CTU8_RAOTE|nr:Methylthioribulose-1-phosphate dehydratase [Raoultella terrigena]